MRWQDQIPARTDVVPDVTYDQHLRSRDIADWAAFVRVAEDNDGGDGGK